MAIEDEHADLDDRAATESESEPTPETENDTIQVDPDLDAADARLRAELTGETPEDDDKATEPEASTDDDGEQEEQSGTEPEPDADEDPPRDEDGSQATDTDATDDEGDPDTTDEQMQRWHPDAKKRIRKLQKERKNWRTKAKEGEAAQQAFDQMSSVCTDSGLNPKDAPGALRLVGKALSGDAEAQQRLYQGMQQAGFAPTAAPASPTITADDLAAALADAEETYDFSKLESLVETLKGEPNKPQQSQAPQQEQSNQPTPQQPQAQNPTNTDADNAVRVRQEGVEATKAYAGALQATLNATYGDEQGKIIGQQILKKAEQDGVFTEGQEAGWKVGLESVANAVLSRMRQTNRPKKAPSTVPSATSGQTKRNPIDAYETKLKKQMGVG